MVVQKGSGMGAMRRTDHIVSVTRNYRELSTAGELKYAVTDNGGWQDCSYLNFALKALPNYTDFTNLFEQFRIDEVKVTFEPTANVNVVVDPAVVGEQQRNYRMLQLGFCADYSGQPLTITDKENTWLECEGYEQHMFDKPISVTLKPKALTLTDAGLTSAYASQAGLWLDCATSNDTPHYGLRWRLYDALFDDGTTQPVGYNMTCYVTMKVSFKGAF